MGSLTKLYANHRIRIHPGEVTVITRTISGKSKIHVQVGQEVTPEEIIGEGFVSGGFRVINLASMLGVAPPEVKKYLQRHIGQKIFQGELLAFKPSQVFSARKIVISPSDLVLESLDEKNGTLMTSFLPKKNDYPAAVYGIVDGIDPKRGRVFIKTEVTKVFGLVGSGRLREGPLRILGQRGDLLRGFGLNKQFEGDILVTGGLVFKDGISAAISLGVGGIISGGINAKDYEGLSGGHLDPKHKIGTDVGISVVVTEGFGSIPMGDDVFQILKQFENKFVIIDGNRAKLILPSCNESCMIRIRKTAKPATGASAGSYQELVEPLPELRAVELVLGQKVRIISEPWMGVQGKIISLDQSPSLLPSGIRTYLITVETRNKKIKVPYTNVEVL